MQRLYDMLGVIIGVRVVDGLALAPGLYDPVFAQQGKLLRGIGLAETKGLGQFAHAFLTVGKLAEQHQPLLIGQRAQQFGRVLRRVLQFFNIHTCKHTHIRIYVKSETAG